MIIAESIYLKTYFLIKSKSVGYGIEMNRIKSPT